MQTDTNGFGDYLSSRLEPQYYNEHEAEDSTITEQVFDIPELLELILMHTHIHDLHNMYLVSRKFKPAIDASPKLAVILGLRADQHADPNSQWYTSFTRRRSPGFSVHRDWGWEESAVTAFVDVTAGKHLPRVGHTWKRMLICQPPVKQMQGFVECSKHYGEASDSALIQSEMGITLGHLNKAAEDLLSDTRNGCVYCASINNDDDSENDPIWPPSPPVMPTTVRFVAVKGEEL